MNFTTSSQNSEVERLLFYSQNSFPSDGFIFNKQLLDSDPGIQLDDTFRPIKPFQLRSISRPEINSYNQTQNSDNLLIRRSGSQTLYEIGSQFSQISSQSAKYEASSQEDDNIKNDDDSLENYSRKEKSLGKLCCKFLQKCCKAPDNLINLDEMTEEMGVERRRMYDIINILETLNGVKRKAKSLYEWCGFESIINALDQISRNEYKAEFLTSKKQKSLTLLTFYFIQLFDRQKQILSLDEAAQKINVNIPNFTNLKTRIRRLYDISNVLCSINLMDKVNNEMNKPTLKWIGVKGLKTFQSQLLEKKIVCNEKKESMSKKSISKTEANETKKLQKPSIPKTAKYFIKEIFPNKQNVNMFSITLKEPKLTTFDEEFYRESLTQE